MSPCSFAVVPALCSASAASHLRPVSIAPFRHAGFNRSDGRISLVQEDLARFDLLTILITNDAFIRAASVPLLAKLVRVSKQTRAILDTEEVRERLLFPKLHITPKFLFDGVDPSIDRLKVARGLFCYALRQNQHKPTNSSMLEKENELWSEVYRDEQLFSRVQRFCQVTDPEFHFPEDARPNGSKQPSVEEMITIAEGQDFRFKWPIEIEQLNITIRPSWRTDRDTYVSKLLPFDIPAINQARERRLTLEDMSFLEVSGWPKTLSDISNLAIEHRDWNQVAGSLISLEGMPNVLPSLTELNLSRCSSLKSLKGMPEMPQLATLEPPPSIESLKDLSKMLPMLTRLDLSRCSQLMSLEGISEMPKLRNTQPLKFINSLEGMSKEFPLVTWVNPSKSIRLTSLHGLSNVPKLLELDISADIETFVDIPDELPSLTKLTISSRMPHNILSQLPTMPKLNHLVLSSQFVRLADLRVSQSSLTVLDLQACCELKSLDDIHSYPKLEILYVPRSIRRVSGLVDKLPSLKTLHLDSSMRSSHHSLLVDTFDRYAGSFSLGWSIIRRRISGLPKGCRVVFSDSVEYTFGRFSR